MYTILTIMTIAVKRKMKKFRVRSGLFHGILK